MIRVQTTDGTWYTLKGFEGVQPPGTAAGLMERRVLEVAPVGAGFTREFVNPAHVVRIVEVSE